MKKITLYGTERCHKTKYYQDFLKTQKIDFTFLDVEENATYAETLRDLYESRKLNFPTITIGDRKLRNPSDNDLVKRLEK